MIGRGTRSIVALAAIALLAGALSACGGSSSSSPASTSSTATEGGGQAGSEAPGRNTGAGGAGGSQENQQGPEAGGQPHESGARPVSPLHVSGGGSGQFRVKGGDNSIQDFGEESGGGELEEAAAALHDFFVARAEGDWGAACALLSKTVAEQLEQLSSRSKSAGKSCPATLAALTPPLPPAVQRESTVVDAGSLRVEGERGFLIYRGAEQTAYAITMAHEGGQWKVGSLAPVPLQ